MPITDIAGQHVHVLGSASTAFGTGSEGLSLFTTPGLFSSPLMQTSDAFPVGINFSGAVAARISDPSSGPFYQVPVYLSDLLADSTTAYGHSTVIQVLVGGPVHNGVISNLVELPAFSAYHQIVSDFLESIAIPSPSSLRQIFFNTGEGVVGVRFDLSGTDGEAFGVNAPQIVFEGPTTLVRQQIDVGGGNGIFPAIIGKLTIGLDTLVWIAGTRDIGTRAAMIALTEGITNPGSVPGIAAAISSSDLVLIEALVPSVYNPSISTSQIVATPIEDLF